MAITQAMCTSFKIALLNGEMDFSSDTTQTFYIALYTSSANLDATTSAYTATGEVADGDGYTTLGKPIIVSTAPTNGGSGTTAYLSFKESGATGDTVTWTDATITARGALIYKSGGGNPAIAVLDFGADKTSTAGDFQVQFPTADATNAIVRIATP